jgi:ribosomal-protein-alanine N-acetyltransferase
VRRAKRTDLGAVFELIQRARGGAFTRDEVISKATGYGYWMAESGGRLLGVAGLLVDNSVACVRDLHTAGAAARGVAAAALLDAVEGEAGGLACEVVIVQAPPDTPVIDALLRDRGYAPRALDELKGLWRDVAREHFGADTRLWVGSLREPRP